MGGFSHGAMSHIKLSQGAFRENPPVSLVPPVSVLVGFPDTVELEQGNLVHSPNCQMAQQNDQ